MYSLVLLLYDATTLLKNDINRSVKCYLVNYLAKN